MNDEKKTVRKCLILAVVFGLAAYVVAAGNARLEELRSEIAKEFLPRNCGAITFTSIFKELEAADAAADAAWRKLGSKSEYDAYRAKMHERYVEAVGGFPERTPLRAKVTSTVVRKGYRVENLKSAGLATMAVAA